MAGIVTFRTGCALAPVDFADLQFRILDLSDVPYIDSTALGALVSAYVSRQKLGRRVVLSGASERVSRMLKITSVESLFLTFPTLEDAIGDLKRAGTA